MKLLISLLWAGAACAEMRPVVITHAHLAEAQEVRRMLLEDYHLPADFISLEESAKPCERRREQIGLHLCVSADGDLEEVHADAAFIQQTLRVFW
jgi:hypothetical protein